MLRVATAISSPAFRELAQRQHQVVSRRQLHQVELTWHHVDARIRAGVWQELGPSVFLPHGGPLSEQQKLGAAVLHGGKGAVLSGLTAARADGLEGFETAAFHVVTPHGSNRDDLEHEQLSVKVHESRRLTDADVHPTRNPPRTRLTRSIVDGASLASNDGRCRAIIAASVQQRLVRPCELIVVARARRTLARRALIIETIGDVEGDRSHCQSSNICEGSDASGCPCPPDNTS
jgi:hypothetical protein